MGEQEKEKKLRLMRFWLFGAFAIIFAAVTVYFGAIAQVFGLVINKSPSPLAVFTNVGYWVFIVVLALLCVGAWYLYKWYLERQKQD